MARVDPTTLMTALKAAAEPSRLRILQLLAHGELNVKDLTRILGQSQPRISRHLKLLAEAGLIERVREGSWAYFHMAERTPVGQLGRILVDSIESRADSLAVRDAARADALKREREEAAQQFFVAHAAQWDSIRSLHVDDAMVEAAIEAAFAGRTLDLFVDLGTGTGRMLELLAGRYERALGIDASHAMLGYARVRLDKARLGGAQVRHGDISNLNMEDGIADGVVMHQVLHYLATPARAIEEAARILTPGGRLVIVDFAPHDLEFLREQMAHVRLGFDRTEIGALLEVAGLEAVSVEALVPPPGGQETKLTVTVWLADKPNVRAGGAARHVHIDGETTV